MSMTNFRAEDMPGNSQAAPAPVEKKKVAEKKPAEKKAAASKKAPAQTDKAPAKSSDEAAKDALKSVPVNTGSPAKEEPVKDAVKDDK